MQVEAGAFPALPAAALRTLLEGGTLPLDPGDGEAPVTLGPDDVQLVRQEREGMTVANDGALTLVLETTLTDALVREGLAREFVSRVQALRKDMDLEVTQRIALRVAGDAEVAAALDEHGDTIRNETLCVDLRMADGLDEAEATDINGHEVRIALTP